MRLFGEFYKNKWNFTAGAAGLVLVGYISFLLVAHYMSQVQLQRASMEEMKQHTEKLATAVSYFYAERKKELKEIALNRTLSIYFQNKALGMSMEYGLRASLLSISELFEQFLNEKTLGQEKIYAKILFTDKDGRLIVGAPVDELAEPELDRPELKKSVGDWAIAPVARNGIYGSVIAGVPFFFKGEVYGRIIAWISPEIVYKQIIKVNDDDSDGVVAYLVTQEGKIVLPRDVESKVPFSSLSEICRISGESIRRTEVFTSDGVRQEVLVDHAPVADTPFFLVTIFHNTRYYQSTPPWQFLLAMGALSLLVLGGTAAAWRIQTRNLVLYARLEEAAKNHREMEEKNRQLELEIAERKRAEEALRESQDKYRIVVDNANEAIFIIQDGVIKFPNPTTQLLTGYSPDELPKIPFTAFVHSEDQEAILDNHLKRLAGEDVENTYSFRAVNKEGKSLYLAANSVLTKWEGRPATLNFLRDMTTQKQLEAQLLHAHKMEAVGTLAGGIAHDFNNILQSILGYSELLLLRKNMDDPEYPQIQQVLSAAQRGAELTRQLLMFSRKIESKPRPMNLNEQIVKTRNLLERTIPKMISIDLKLADDLRTTNADPIQIEQVLMNLAVNARDAMPEGGRLTIETENAYLNEQETGTLVSASPGNYVLLSVSDTGHGMDEKVRERIFEPFYTTKGIGKGTGLGLAMVYGIVKSHGGFIKCSSTLGLGTTFHIYLPTAELQICATEENATLGIQSSNETILLVDDDQIIRDLGEQILPMFGYKLYMAENGKDALDIFGKEWEQIDLVLLDLIMPVMSGKECLKELLRINRDLKVIITSGYSPAGTINEVLEMGAAGFVSKPYKIKQLLNVIRTTLGTQGLAN